MADWKWLWLYSLVYVLIKPGITEGRLRGTANRKEVMRNKTASASSFVSNTNEANPSVEQVSPSVYFDRPKRLVKPIRRKFFKSTGVHSQSNIEGKAPGVPPPDLYSDSSSTPNLHRDEGNQRPASNIYRNGETESELGLYRGANFGSSLENALLKSPEAPYSLDLQNYNFQLPSNFDFRQNVHSLSRKQQRTPSRKQGGDINDIKAAIRNGVAFGGYKRQGKNADARYGYYADGTVRKHQRKQNLADKILKEIGLQGHNALQPDPSFSKFQDYGGGQRNFMSSDWYLTHSLPPVGGFKNQDSMKWFPNMMQFRDLSSIPSGPQVQYRISNDAEEPENENDKVERNERSLQQLFS